MDYPLRYIKKNDKIFLAGHNGLVGSAVLNKLNENGFKKLLHVIEKIKSLDQNKVIVYFFNKPKGLAICAAKVGGVNANKNNKADFIYENMTIQNNLINAAFKYNVKDCFSWLKLHIFSKFKTTN